MEWLRNSDILHIESEREVKEWMHLSLDVITRSVGILGMRGRLDPRSVLSVARFTGTMRGIGRD